MIGLQSDLYHESTTAISENALFSRMIILLLLSFLLVAVQPYNNTNKTNKNKYT